MQNLNLQNIYDIYSYINHKNNIYLGKLLQIFPHILNYHEFNIYKNRKKEYNDIYRILKYNFTKIKKYDHIEFNIKYNSNKIYVLDLLFNFYSYQLFNKQFLEIRKSTKFINDIIRTRINYATHLTLNKNLAHCKKLFLNSPNLKVLNLSYNNLTTSEFSSICGNVKFSKSLKYIILDNNNIDMIIKFKRQLPKNLKRISIKKNPIEFIKIPKSITIIVDNKYYYKKIKNFLKDNIMIEDILTTGYFSILLLFGYFLKIFGYNTMIFVYTVNIILCATIGFTIFRILFTSF